MPVEDKLAELDALLKGLRIDVLSVVQRAAFDHEAEALDKMIQAARLLVAEARLEVGYLKERLG